MGVWGSGTDAEYLARMVSHPARHLVERELTRLIQLVRATGDRSDTHEVQRDLLGLLLDAERRYNAANVARKRAKGSAGVPDWDLEFWRRVCVQYRAVGDAIAWRFLSYRRQWIVLMGQNQRPGLLSGKQGTRGELEAFEGHWAAGRPTLLTGITNAITIGDLLVDEGDGHLRTVEVKSGKGRYGRGQRQRMIDLTRQLNDAPRVTSGSFPTYVLESEVDLKSYWSESQDALADAMSTGLRIWVPQEGIAVLFVYPPASRATSLDEANDELERERAGVGDAMGAVTHRIVANSTDLPYRPNRTVPLPLLPVDPAVAAMLLTGVLLFKTEISVDMMVRALQAGGLDAEIALPDEEGRLQGNTPIIRWRRGIDRGLVHASAMEQLAFELVYPDIWAASHRSLLTRPGPEAKFGTYLCFRNEERIWA